MVVSVCTWANKEFDMSARKPDTCKLKECQLLPSVGHMAPDESMSVTAGMHGVGIPMTSSKCWAVASW